MTDDSRQPRSHRKPELEIEVARLQQENSSLKTELEKLSSAFYENRAALVINRFHDAVFLDVNDACLEVLGFTREEMLGKSAWELNIWADLTEREQILNHFSKVGYVRNFECNFRRKRGEVVLVIICSSITEIGGEKCMLTTAIDISQHQKSEESSKKAQQPQAQLLEAYFPE